MARRQVLELLGKQLEPGDADRHHHASGMDHGAGLERQRVAVLAAQDVDDVVLFEGGDIGPREPVGIGDEVFDGDRGLLRRIVLAVRSAPGFERGVLIRRRQVGGEALRLQAHAPGHVIAPGAHRLAEDAEGYSRRSQMGGKRKAVGAGSDDGNVDAIQHGATSLSHFGTIPVSARRNPHFAASGADVPSSVPCSELVEARALRLRHDRAAHDDNALAVRRKAGGRLCRRRRRSRGAFARGPCGGEEPVRRADPWL